MLTDTTTNQRITRHTFREATNVSPAASAHSKGPVLAKLIEIRQKAEEERRKADEERRKADEDIATHIKEQERVEKERQKAMEAKANKKRSKEMTQSVSY